MSVSDPNLTHASSTPLSETFSALKMGKPSAIYIALALFIATLALAVSTWGLVALAMTALAFVPIVMVALILITVGK